MTFNNLISVSELAGQLEDPSWAIIDCRFDLVDLDRGEAEYRQAHIPGAVYAHLERDLSAAPDGRNGRHPLPEPAVLAARFSALGIGAETQVVAYDASGGPFASRLWWSLHWLGHEAAAVLDGGFPAWVKDGHPLREGFEVRPPATFIPSSAKFGTSHAEQVLSAIQDNKHLLLDARAPERYRGEEEPLDSVAGHIPGAANYFWQLALDEEGKFRPADELRVEFETLLDGRAPEDVITYCGSGVTGAHLQLAMRHAGLEGMRLYPGSWSEWCADTHRPIAAGAPGKPD